MKAPTDPKERSRVTRLAVERHQRETEAWRQARALIKRVSGSSLAFLKPKRKK